MFSSSSLSNHTVRPLHSIRPPPSRCSDVVTCRATLGHQVINHINAAAMALGMWRPLVSDARPPPTHIHAAHVHIHSTKRKSIGCDWARRYQTGGCPQHQPQVRVRPYVEKPTQPALIYQLHSGELCENDDLCFGLVKRSCAMYLHSANYQAGGNLICRGR